MRLRAFVLALTIALGGQAAAAIPSGQKPDLTVKTKLLDATVTLDKGLAAHPELREDLLAEGRRVLAKWRADAEKEKRETPELFQDGRRWTFERSYVLRSVVGRYVSVLRDDGTYQGGAHPNSVADTILWDRDARKPISIRPFFKETADSGPTMKELARLARLAVAARKIERRAEADKPNPEPKVTPEEHVKDDSMLRDGIQPSLLKIGPISLARSTVPGKSAGLTFHYSPYAVGAYAEGPFTIFVPWTAFGQFLTPEGAAIFGGERPKDDTDD